MSFLYAALLIGVLVFVHELGHFLVAKFFDVHVIRFSIGFGPKLFGFTRGETEYVICALPLGGYVQMLGMSFDSVEDVPPEERKRALMMKPIWQRSLVVLGGPVFNLVFPIILYFLIVMFGSSKTMPSIVGEVFSEMPAAMAGLQPGDKIVAIDGEPVKYWYQINRAVMPNPDTKIKFEFERDGKRQEIDVTTARKSRTDFLGLNSNDFGMIGIHSGTFGSTIGIDSIDSPAAKGGLRHFDKIIALNDQSVTRFDEVQSYIRNNGDKPVRVVVLRRDRIRLGYGDFYEQTKFETDVTPAKIDGQWSFGIQAGEMFVSNVVSKSPAAIAGILPGDQLVSVDGEEFSNWGLLVQSIKSDVSKLVSSASETGDDPTLVDKTYVVKLVRNRVEKTVELKPTVSAIERGTYFQVNLGLAHIPDVTVPSDIDFPFGERFVFAVDSGLRQTWRFIQMTMMGVVRMVQGRMSLNNVSGPIQIGSLAAQAGRAGWDKFFQMMAIISINLGIINLLPIPILDGGNLVLFALEAIKRGPLSFRVRQISAYIGFSLIIMLFVLAFKNDIERQWDNVAEYVNEF